MSSSRPLSLQTSLKIAGTIHFMFRDGWGGWGLPHVSEDGLHSTLGDFFIK